MKTTLKTRELVLTPLLAALLVVSKEILAFLPNVELVTLFIILYTLHYPRLTPYIIYLFVGVECCLYGLNVWVYMYLYIWILLYFAVRALRRMGSYLLWVVVAALFGLLFGLLCSPVYLFIGGWNMAISWFLSGAIFDLFHAVGNAVVALVLFRPLDRLFTEMQKKYFPVQ